MENMSGDNTSVASGSSYPALDATSPTDSVIQGRFQLEAMVSSSDQSFTIKILYFVSKLYV